MEYKNPTNFKVTKDIIFLRIKKLQKAIFFVKSTKRLDNFMTNKTTISAAKPWMKYFSEESKRAEFPKMKVYSYFKEVNKKRLQQTALYYYGTKISVKKMIEKYENDLKTNG